MNDEARTPIGSADPQRTRRSTGRKLRRWAASLLVGAVLLVVAFMGMGATTGDHTLGSVTYAQVPPNSGSHSPVWQRCGFYAAPVGNEHAVHTLEHGAVWITYQPDLSAERVEVLRAPTRSQDDVLVSPYPGLPAPIVVSAWGRQIPLDAVDAAQLDQALRDIRNGLEAPEPGAGCDGPNLWLSGGTGNPET